MSHCSASLGLAAEGQGVDRYGRRGRVSGRRGRVSRRSSGPAVRSTRCSGNPDDVPVGALASQPWCPSTCPPVEAAGAVQATPDLSGPRSGEHVVPLAGARPVLPRAHRAPPWRRPTCRGRDVRAPAQTRCPTAPTPQDRHRVDRRHSVAKYDRRRLWTRSWSATDPTTFAVRPVRLLEHRRGQAALTGVQADSETVGSRDPRGSTGVRWGLDGLVLGRAGASCRPRLRGCRFRRRLV
jgi:hypothetical protein